MFCNTKDHAFKNTSNRGLRSALDSYLSQLNDQLLYQFESLSNASNLLKTFNNKVNFTCKIDLLNLSIDQSKKSTLGQQGQILDLMHFRVIPMLQINPMSNLLQTYRQCSFFLSSLFLSCSFSVKEILRRSLLFSFAPFFLELSKSKKLKKLSGSLGL